MVSEAPRERKTNRAGYPPVMDQAQIKYGPVLTSQSPGQLTRPRSAFGSRSAVAAPQNVPRIRPSSAVPRSNLSPRPPPNPTPAAHAAEKPRPVSAGSQRPGMNRCASANTLGANSSGIISASQGSGGRPSSAMVFRPVGAAGRLKQRPSTAHGTRGSTVDSKVQTLGGREAQSSKSPRLSTLAGAGACFEETILRDNTFGPLLREIKAAYDSYLWSCGAPLNGGRLDSSAAERGVDAIRRAYAGDDSDWESETPCGNAAAIRSLEVENAMLRAAHAQLAEKLVELQRSVRSESDEVE